MQVSRILAAALLSVAAAGAMAQELDRDTSTFVSTRTRAAVEAEAQNAEASGQWNRGGENRDPVFADTKLAHAPQLTRAQVRDQVAAARAAHQLPRVGDMM